MILDVTKVRIERNGEVRIFQVGINAKRVHINDVDEIDSKLPYLKIVKMNDMAEIFPLAFYKISFTGLLAEGVEIE